MLITNFSLKGTFDPETGRKLTQLRPRTLIQTTDLMLRAMDKQLTATDF